MTSAIVSSTIDADFPISGQDNDSQGFRDNFNAIKDGLATAASEITVLQTNTAKLNEGNDFNGVLIGNALTNQLYGRTFSTTTVSNTTVDLENGDYQAFTITGNHTLTFANWPAFDDNRHAKLRVEINSNGTSYNVTFATTGGGALKLLGGLTSPVATGTDPLTPKIFEVWSSDNGTTVYVNRIATEIATVVTYAVSAETTTGGANLQLAGSDASTDTVKLAGGSNIAVARTDASTITINYTHSAQGATGNVVALANQYISVDTSGGPVTVTLPTTISPGNFVVIADNGNAATNNVIIDPGSNNINGAAGDKIISVNFTMVTLVSDGIGWIASSGTII